MSRKVADKGKLKTVLDEVGLDTATIAMLIENNPDDMESAVQAGLTKWSGGQGRPPTWQVLCEAMNEAEINVRDINSLKQALQKPPSAPTGGMSNVLNDPVMGISTV